MRKIVLLAAAVCALLCGCTKDTAAPQLTTTALTVAEGEQALPCALIEAVDETDGAIAVTEQMISGEYDLNTAGEYTLTVTLTDSAGNSAQQALVLTVSAPVFDEDASLTKAWSFLLGYWSGIDYGDSVFYLRFYTYAGQRECEWGIYGADGESTSAQLTNFSVNSAGTLYTLKLTPYTQTDGAREYGAAQTMQLYPDITVAGRMRAMFAPQDFARGVEYLYIGTSADFEAAFSQYAPNADG